MTRPSPNSPTTRRHGVLAAAVTVLCTLSVVTVIALRTAEHSGSTGSAGQVASAAREPSDTASATDPVAEDQAAEDAAQETAETDAAQAAEAAQEQAAAAARSAAFTALVTAANTASADSVSVAALNLTTGASFTAGSTGDMFTGSIVKLYILETLLVQRQDDGGLTSSEQDTARTMIENSDNDAAETLFEDIGGRDALIAANPVLGVVGTTPGPGDYWGLTTTDATDYIALLRNLVVATGGPLTETSQAYVLDLMRNVESDQRWGVGVTADAGTDFANKNGWLGVDDDGGRWLVNSVGIVTVGGQPVLLAVLTQHNADFGSGVALTESLATQLAPLVSPDAP